MLAQERPDDPGEQRRPYEPPVIEVIDVVPEIAVLSICKLSSGSGPLAACVACSVGGS